jgi:hypothetical protein
MLLCENRASWLICYDFAQPDWKAAKARRIATREPAASDAEPFKRAPPA